jgi:pimeloyl-ACP methyl ester carboxylesterase
VPTPYGTINVYEFGPVRGEKVLLLPGVSTPVVALGDLASSLADDRGYRVMCFDYFGRGYSDAVGEDLEYDQRLFTTQILLALASSPLAWTGEGEGEGFHLVGYSLGGGLAVGFARFFPGMVRSLVFVAGGGLVRRDTHESWRSRVLYGKGWLPEGWLQGYVRRRISPPAKKPRRGGPRRDDEGPEREDRKDQHCKDVDVDGTEGWGSALLSKRRGDGTTVADIMEWQIAEHKGFVKAFMSSMGRAPIYDRKEEWAALGALLAERRKGSRLAGLRGGKMLIVLGTKDSVIIRDELVEDATGILGREAVDIVELDAGHEVVFTHAEEVAEAAVSFWKGIP